MIMLEKKSKISSSIAGNILLEFIKVFFYLTKFFFTNIFHLKQYDKGLYYSGISLIDNPTYRINKKSEESTLLPLSVLRQTLIGIFGINYMSIIYHQDAQTAMFQLSDNIGNSIIPYLEEMSCEKIGRVLMRQKILGTNGIWPKFVLTIAAIFIFILIVVPAILF